MSLFYNIPMKQRYAIWLALTALAAALWLPNLFTYGMFMDGVINASVAKLYAEGTGAFFNLQERYYENGTYAGHPPLAFVIQSSFFKVFGSAFYMDKLYSLLCAISQLVLIILLWQSLVKDEMKKLSWLPCLLWLISPIISWGYSSNLLENTMSLFTTAALIVILKYIRQSKYMLLYSAAAALLTFAALLCKGPVALFVLAAPVVFVNLHAAYTLRKALAYTSLITVFLSVLCSVVLLMPEGRQFVTGYLNEQLKPSLNTDGFSFIARTAILLHLLKALSAPVILTALTYQLGKRLSFIRSNQNFENTNLIGFRFMLLGLCATLPIMLSNKQSAFYIIPAMPVFAVALAAFIAPAIHNLHYKLATPQRLYILSAISVLLLLVMAALSVHNYGTILRDKDMLEDAAQIDKLVQGEKIIWDPENDYAQEYALKAYLSRLYGKEVHHKYPSDWIMLKKQKLNYHEREKCYEGNLVNVYYLEPVPPVFKQ